MATQTFAGLTSSYDIEVRKADGTLFYQEASVMFPELPSPPAAPTCHSDACIEQYKAAVDRWAAECREKAELYKLIHKYHAMRGAYCMKHKHETIEDKYRTGTPVPTTIREITLELNKFRR